MLDKNCGKFGVKQNCIGQTAGAIPENMKQKKSNF